MGEIPSWLGTLTNLKWAEPPLLSRWSAVVAVAVGAGTVAVACVLILAQPSPRSDVVEELQAEIDRLRNETCVEVKLMQASIDILQIELKALHGIPPDERLSAAPAQDGSPYQEALLEVMGSVYTDPPMAGGADRLLNRC